MKEKKKLTYKQQQQREKAKTIIKWVFCGLGWSLLATAFVSLVVVGVKGCNNKKQPAEALTGNITTPVKPVQPHDVIYDYDWNSTLYQPVTSARADYLYVNMGLSNYTGQYTMLNYGVYDWRRDTNPFWATQLRGLTPNLTLRSYTYSSSITNPIGARRPLAYIDFVREIHDSNDNYVSTESLSYQYVSSIGFDNNSLVIEYNNTAYNGSYSTTYINLNHFGQNGLTYNNQKYYAIGLNIRFYRYRLEMFYSSSVGDDSFNIFEVQGVKNGDTYPSDLLGRDLNSTDIFILLSHVCYFYQYIVPESISTDGGLSYKSLFRWQNDNLVNDAKTLVYTNDPRITIGGDEVNGVDPSGTNNVFSLISQAFNSVAVFFAIQVIPGVTFGTLFAVPVVSVLILFIVKLFKR